MDQRTQSNRRWLAQIARQAMLDRGLEPDLSSEARREVDAIHGAAVESDPAIRDLRSLMWASIDNDDSRDLDQLTVAEPAGADAVRIRVAIADVDAAVKLGTAIDEHARVNTTSVYTAAEIFPMLPEKLSTDLTSLVEGQDRLAVVVDMEVSSSGVVIASSLYRAVVQNHAKLAYDSVAAWLDGRANASVRFAAVPGLDEQVRLQDRVAQSMKDVREEHGALNFETNKAHAVFDGDELLDLQPDERNRAKELIENFMIAANGVTAQFLEAKGFPLLRRVLRTPERWERIVDLAAAHGDRLPAKANAQALAEFLVRRRAKDPLRFQDVSLAVIKLLGSGEYALSLAGEEAEGHFGLAVRDYTHSTAPNRRFPDLITQRTLKAALAGRPPAYNVIELRALAEHCTAQEDNAVKVERHVQKSAAALLLAPSVGKRFDAIVTGASEKGTWVRIFHPPVEGKVVRGFDGLDVGDRVRVKLLGVDVERGFIDFARARERG